MANDIPISKENLMTQINKAAIAGLVASALLSACTSDDVELPELEPGLEVLGGNTHSVGNVDWEDVLDSGDLNTPMDLAFHPSNSGEMWIVNQGDPSMTIVSDVSADNWSVQTKSHATSDHFMVKPASLAFGDNGKMATIHEEEEHTPYTWDDAPGTFMGPTLWTSDKSEFDGGHGSHYDMLHNSPNGVGIAWETENIYWVFDGYHESLTRYDFGDDHNAGGTDHSDGEVLRYAKGDVSYEAGVASHLAFDAATDLLYVADSGNGRIAVLDTTSGSVGGNISPNYDGSSQRKVTGADIWTLADSESSDLEMPSGLALHDDMIFVVDHATSIIWAFDLDGVVIDWLDTGVEPYSLMGLDFDADGRIYITDAAEDRVYRLAASG
jgi:hypothetical protein